MRNLILLPLVAAFGLERWAAARADREAVVTRLGWLPVPLVALVVFLIAASQVDAVRDALPVLAQVAGVYVAYLIAAAFMGAATGRLAGLPAPGQRTLIFSLGTRNSFVVLPLALALGSEWSTAAVVIVFQSLVELFGMVVYLWILPRVLVPEPRVAVEEQTAPRATRNLIRAQETRGRRPGDRRGEGRLPLGARQRIQGDDPPPRLRSANSAACCAFA